MPAPAAPGGLRIALLCYRGNPHCGGQGVYTAHLASELVKLGHSVEVFAGQPWPILEDAVGFTPVPSLDLYRSPDPFRIVHLKELVDKESVIEFLTMLSGGFAEPRVFARRVRRILATRRGEFDIVHDNQCLGRAIVALSKDGWPLLTTLHHPITVDRRLALDHAKGLIQKLSTWRWFGFVRMQMRVARRLPAIVTVSHSSLRDIAQQMGVDPSRMRVVPVGVDHDIFRLHPEVQEIPGRLMVTTSSDVPLKGLVPLLEAVARLRNHREISLLVVGKPSPNGRVEKAIERLDLSSVVTFVHGISDEELARHYAEAQIAVVPSLYEGFSLPAIEAMASGRPLIATTGGALPEVVGSDGETALLVPPDDAGALADAIDKLLDDPARRLALGEAGRNRVLKRFTWEVMAKETAQLYETVLDRTTNRVNHYVDR
jgi:glycosyltransferase involved in cell wall biosynthesis